MTAIPKITFHELVHAMDCTNGCQFNGCLSAKQRISDIETHKKLCKTSNCKLCEGWATIESTFSINKQKPLPKSRKADPYHAAPVPFASLDKYRMFDLLMYLRSSHLQSFSRIIDMPSSFDKQRLSLAIVSRYFSWPLKDGYVQSLLKAFVERRHEFIKLLESEHAFYRKNHISPSFAELVFPALKAWAAPSVAAPPVVPPPPVAPTPPVALTPPVAPPPPAAAPPPAAVAPPVASIRVVLKGETLPSSNTRSLFDTMNSCMSMPRLQWKESKDDLITTSTISLMDPISLLRIEVPCKTALCKHANAFDLKTHCRRFIGRDNWKCPICECNAAPRVLRIDDFIQTILQSSTHETKAVEVDKTGLITKINGKRKMVDLDEDEGSSALPICIDSD